MIVTRSWAPAWSTTRRASSALAGLNSTEYRRPPGGSFCAIRSALGPRSRASVLPAKVDDPNLFADQRRLRVNVTGRVLNLVGRLVGDRCAYSIGRLWPAGMS